MNYISKLDDLSIVNVMNAISAAEEPVVNVGNVACGRVYLDFGKLRAGSKAMKLIENSLGKKFMSRPYYSYKCLYIGYDNASGLEYKRALQLAKKFENAGVYCFADADMD